MTKDLEKQLAILQKGVEEIVPEGGLQEKLLLAQKENRPLIVKLGLDPTAPDIHLGHAVVLRKMREFQDLGHQVVLIVGDFTTLIGDPTGRSKTRPPLQPSEIRKNAETYKKQVFKILDEKKTKVVFNSEWFSKLSHQEIIKLLSKATVAQILERDDFKMRMQKNISIFMHELWYPFLQGYDSVAVKADIEMGGTDQRFNILFARELQQAYYLPQQIAMLMPILVGLDGEKKMSKSLGNYIGITESPDQQFGKIMSIPDNLIIPYFKLLTTLPEKELAEMEKEIKTGKLNPRDAKAKLGKTIVADFHSKEDAEKAEKEFEKIFREKQTPTEIKIVALPLKKYFVLDLLVEAGLALSKSEAKRLVQQKALKIDDQVLDDWKKEIEIKSGMIIRAGKLKFVKIK